MNKYLNVIILAFFAVLTTKFNLGLNLFIPMVCFLVFMNYKNLLFIMPVSFMALFLFDQTALFGYLVFMASLCLYSLIYKNPKSYYINLIYVFVISIITSFITLKINSFDEFGIVAIYSLIGVICFGYFQFNLEGSLYKQNRVRNYTFVEFVMAIIAVFGASNILVGNLNLSLFVSVYFCMYFSQNKYEIHSLFFSLITMFTLRFMFKIEESILIPFVSAFYMFPNLYGAITLISFCLFAWLGDFKLFSVLTLQVTIAVSLIFELFKFSLVSVDPSNEEIGVNIYDNLVNLLNNEIMGFASFLDLYGKSFSTSKEYNQKLNEGINNLCNTYCSSCYVRSECLQKNQGKIYVFFKTLILYPSRGDIESINPEVSDIFKSCIYANEMRRNSILINERLNIASISNKSNALIAQINGISNILRQYSIDFTTKVEIDYEIFTIIKKSLIDYGFNVTLFNCKRSFSHDFLIEVGLKGVVFIEVKDIIEKIINNYIHNKVSVIYVKSHRNRTYINIVPKIHFEVEYGYGSIAQDGNNICGDNYLIKELDTARIIAAISDGMGKGYLAYQESNNTIKLIDEITNWHIQSSTALQIINTFYSIQDYQEKYSTLDFVEIDRSKGTMYLFKLGGSSTYIIHEDGTNTQINNKALPVGLEELVQIETIQLKGNDLIILASDGVFDNDINQVDVQGLINNIRHMPPQKIAYEILNYSLKNQYKRRDDLSIIALKVNLIS